jgi:hypothetical protein
MRATWVCILSVASILLVYCEGKNPIAHDTFVVRLDNTAGRDQRRFERGRMRDFLWNHWIQGKAATLNLTTVTKEGHTNHSQYEVILIPSKTMLLKVSFVHDRIGYQGQVIPRLEPGYEVYTVERVESANRFRTGSHAADGVLKNEMVVPSEDYWLRFKTWDDGETSCF